MDDDCDRDLNSEPVRKLIKVANRVRRANRKLVTFERGFIDEEGLSGREWYKHLGVAPGYWLGESELLHHYAYSLMSNLQVMERRLCQALQKR